MSECEQTLEDNRTTWMYRAEAAEARVARLEEALQKIVNVNSYAESVRIARRALEDK